MSVSAYECVVWAHRGELTVLDIPFCVGHAARCSGIVGSVKGRPGTFDVGSKDGVSGLYPSARLVHVDSITGRGCSQISGTSIDSDLERLRRIPNVDVSNVDVITTKRLHVDTTIYTIVSTSGVSSPESSLNSLSSTREKVFKMF